MRSKNAELVYRLKEGLERPLERCSTGDLITELLGRLGEEGIFMTIGKQGGEVPGQ